MAVTPLRWLHGLDSCLCLLLFFPSMVFYWRGIWNLLGVYIYPNEVPKCHWVTTGIGACSIVGYFLQPLLSHILSKVQSRVIYVIVTRVYMVAYGILTMAYWRGVWSIAEYYLLPYGWTAGAVGLFICHSILFALRTSRTTIFPPFVVSLDTRDDLLVPNTCLKSQVNWSKASSVVWYTFDSFLTQFVVLTLTILTWRSSLNLIDSFLLPEDELNSNLLSFGIGLAGTIILFALEPSLTLLGNHIRSKSVSPWPWLLFEDCVYFVVFAVECFLWRGGWNLNVYYIISDPLVGGWVNNAIGTVLLLSLQLFSYVSGCGCGQDGPPDDDPSPREDFYDTRYLRTFYRYFRQT